MIFIADGGSGGSAMVVEEVRSGSIAGAYVGIQSGGSPGACTRM